MPTRTGFGAYINYSRLINRKLRAADREAHNKLLAGARASVDSGTPKSIKMKHVHWNQGNDNKKRRISRKVEMQNRQLLKMLEKVAIRDMKDGCSWNKKLKKLKIAKSPNLAWQEKECKRINSQNKMLFSRLQHAPGDRQTSFKQLQKEHRRNRQIVCKLSSYDKSMISKRSKVKEGRKRPGNFQGEKINPSVVGLSDTQWTPVDSRKLSTIKNNFVNEDNFYDEENVSLTEKVSNNLEIDNMESMSKYPDTTQLHTSNINSLVPENSDKTWNSAATKNYQHNNEVSTTLSKKLNKDGSLPSMFHDDVESHNPFELQIPRHFNVKKSKVSDANNNVRQIKEKRIDISDGNEYTYEEFIEYYGGEEEWDAAILSTTQITHKTSSKNQQKVRVSFTKHPSTNNQTFYHRQSNKVERRRPQTAHVKRSFEKRTKTPIVIRVRPATASIKSDKCMRKNLILGNAKSIQSPYKKIQIPFSVKRRSKIKRHIKMSANQAHNKKEAQTNSKKRVVDIGANTLPRSRKKRINVTNVSDQVKTGKSSVAYVGNKSNSLGQKRKVARPRKNKCQGMLTISKLEKQRSYEQQRFSRSFAWEVGEDIVLYPLGNIFHNCEHKDPNSTDLDQQNFSIQKLKNSPLSWNIHIIDIGTKSTAGEDASTAIKIIAESNVELDDKTQSDQLENHKLIIFLSCSQIKKACQKSQDLRKALKNINLLDAKGNHSRFAAALYDSHFETSLIWRFVTCITKNIHVENTKDDQLALKFSC